MDTELSGRLKRALHAARQAGVFVLEHFRAGVSVELKDDASPVTVADRGCEKLLRRLIGSAFPADGILGEEFGESPGQNDWRWIIDPIDGTRSFIAGVPLFGVLIGLEKAGVAVLGVVHLPGLDEMVWAAHELGAWWLPAGTASSGKPPRPARVSGRTELSESLVTSSGGKGFDLRGSAGAYARLRQRAALERGWGDCYGHMLVATGRAEVMVDPAMHIWDNAALAPIIQEAGGRFSDWSGQHVHTGPDAISTNGPMHATVLELLREGD